MEEDIKKETSSDRENNQEQARGLDAEIKAGEWQSLKRFKTYRNRSRQGKIIATYQAISNRLNQLVGMYYRFVRDNPKQAAKMLDELRRLRLLQEVLLNCLVWEPAGDLERDMIPGELWELIE